MLNRLKEWWTLDEVAEENSADNPLSALNDNQRRNTGPLLALAFGWGFSCYRSIYRHSTWQWYTVLARYHLHNISR